MTKRQKMIAYINSMGIEERIALHNTYCDAVNCMEECIYSMEELEEVFCDAEKWWLIDRIRFGSFDFDKDFFGFNGYGNLDSYYVFELPIFSGDIADYILSEEDALGNDKIQDILDEEDEDNE